MTEPTAAGPSDITVADYLRDNHPQVLARLRRQQCPVCGRAMRHVATDHLTCGGHTPPVFRCAEPGPDHFHPDYRGPDLTWGYWSTNGVQVAWYRTLDPQWTPWLLWEQQLPPVTADAVGQVVEGPATSTAVVSVRVELAGGQPYTITYAAVHGLTITEDRHLRRLGDITNVPTVTAASPDGLTAIDFAIIGRALPTGPGTPIRVLVHDPAPVPDQVQTRQHP